MAALIACAVFVVRTRNLVHSVFWLAATLLVTAALYVTLDAPFISAIQVLLYTGGVITMMLFGVMLTQREPDTNVPNLVGREVPAGLIAAVLLGLLLSAIWGSDALAFRGAGASGAPAEVGGLFLDEQLLAFEVLSVLLLATMIGAIVLARKADP